MKNMAARLPWLTLGGSTLALALWLGPGATPAGLVYDRTAIAAGEIWRLWSGHWVHVDAAHALWNIGALVLLGLLLEPAGRLRLLAAILAGMTGVSAALWWGLPDLERYCGLSGMLNALVPLALARYWRASPLFPLLAPGFAGKLLLENLQQGSLLLSSAWPAIPAAHLAGALVGLLLLALPAHFPGAPQNPPEAPTMPAGSTGNNDTWTAAKPSSK